MRLNTMLALFGLAVYRVAAGRSRMVRITLNNAVNLHHALPVTVTSLEQGLKGSETVVRRVRLHA